MKYISVILLACSLAFAAKSPFGPALDKKLKEIGPKRSAKFTFDASVGSQGDSTDASGEHALGQLPAGAIVTRSWLWIDTAFVSDSGGLTSNIAFYCEDSGNLVASFDPHTIPADNAIDGAASGASTAFGLIAADCDVKSAVTGSSFTAGKAFLFVDYVVTQ